MAFKLYPIAHLFLHASVHEFCKGLLGLMHDKVSYSKSFELGLRPGSLERNPNTKSEMKKITTV
jgi:hypothetical protein